MIIGLCGLISSGKSTVADILVKEFEFTQLSFASALKDMTANIFGWDRDMLEGSTPESRELRSQKDEFWSKELGYDVTPRSILQIMGTEVFRNNFYNDIWVAVVKRKILNLNNKNVVITDCRFPNEITMIHGLGGAVWKVKRGEDPEWMKTYLQTGIKPVDVHSSEWEWAMGPFDYTVFNMGNLADLKNSVMGYMLTYIGNRQSKN